MDPRVALASISQSVLKLEGWEVEEVFLEKLQQLNPCSLAVNSRFRPYTQPPPPGSLALCDSGFRAYTSHLSSYMSSHLATCHTVGSARGWHTTTVHWVLKPLSLLITHSLPSQFLAFPRIVSSVQLNSRPCELLERDLVFTRKWGAQD